ASDPQTVCSHIIAPYGRAKYDPDSVLDRDTTACRHGRPHSARAVDMPGRDRFKLQYPNAPYPFASAADLVNGKSGMTRSFLAMAPFIAATAMLQKAAAQDVDKGQRSFNKCLPCHAAGPGGQNKVGPELNGLDGRQAGTSSNFSYSDANKNSGIVCNEPTFKHYIPPPPPTTPPTNS